jgi:glucose-6-phosphate isomerase
VLHTALRLPATATLPLDGEDVVPAVHDVLQRMQAFTDQVRSGSGWVIPASPFAMW